MFISRARARGAGLGLPRDLFLRSRGARALHVFELDGDEPDPVTGMWVVKPEMDHGGNRVCGIIPVDSIVRACHLIGLYGRTKIPIGFDYTETLDVFQRYYVNWHADYHAHETII